MGSPSGHTRKRGDGSTRKEQSVMISVIVGGAICFAIGVIVCWVVFLIIDSVTY